METEAEMKFVGAAVGGLNTAEIDGRTSLLDRGAWIGGESDVIGSMSYNQYRHVLENEVCWSDDSYGR